MMEKDKKSEPKEFITKYGYKWYPDGTCGKKEGLLIIFLGKEEILNIFNHIEKKLNRSIDKLLRLAKRIVTVNVINQEFIGRLMKVLIRARFISNERLKNILNKKLISTIGWGVCEKSELNFKEKSAYFIIKNYPSLPLIEGAVGGLVQYVFNLKSVRFESREKNRKAFIHILPKKEEEELAKYILKPVLGFELGLLPGDIEYEFSEKNIPKEFFDIFEWRIKEGLIYDKRTNKEQMLFTRYAIDATFNLLKRELGEDFISEAIFEGEKNYIKELLKGTTQEIQNKLLTKKEFGIKGWGLLKEVKKGENSYTIQVNNPFNSEIIAGFLSGFFETKEGVELKTEWKEQDNFLKVILKK